MGKNKGGKRKLIEVGSLFNLNCPLDVEKYSLVLHEHRQLIIDHVISGQLYGPQNRIIALKTLSLYKVGNSSLRMESSLKEEIHRLFSFDFRRIVKLLGDDNDALPHINLHPRLYLSKTEIKEIEELISPLIRTDFEILPSSFLPNNLIGDMKIKADFLHVKDFSDWSKIYTSEIEIIENIHGMDTDTAFEGRTQLLKSIIKSFSVALSFFRELFVRETEFHKSDNEIKKINSLIMKIHAITEKFDIKNDIDELVVSEDDYLIRKQLSALLFCQKSGYGYREVFHQCISHSGIGKGIDYSTSVIQDTKRNQPTFLFPNIG